MTANRLHFWISGDVQGVFFRQSAVRQAEALGVTGWIANLSDGQVEALAEGPRRRFDRIYKLFRVTLEPAPAPALATRPAPSGTPR